MKEVQILINAFKQKISDKDNKFTYDLLKSCLSIIDAEINKKNGIAGYKLKSHLIFSEKSGDLATDIKKYLKSNDNVIALHGNFPTQQEIDVDKYVYFKTGTGLGEDLKLIKNSTMYYDSKTDTQAKLSAIEDLIKKKKDLENIFFINDGPKTVMRMQHYERDISRFAKDKFQSFNFIEFKDETSISKKLKDITNITTKKDIIILDVGIRVIRPIFKYYNENPDSIGLIILTFGTIEGRFNKILFPLIEIKSLQNIYTTINLHSLYNKIGIKINERQRELVLNSIYRVDYPLLLKEAADKISHTPNTKEDLVRSLNIAMRDFDGENDIFVGYRHVLAFKNNINIYKSCYTYIFPKSLHTHDSFHKILYNTQYFPENNKVIKIKANIISIDVVRVTDINIADATFGCEFFLDISSVYENPMDIIIFNNLSIKNSKFEYKLLEKKKDDNTENINYRYYIVANLDFEPVVDNYPFDWQHIYISYSINDINKHGIIQPVPEVLLDKDFNVEGWKFRDAVTGVKRSKQFSYTGDDLRKKVNIKEVARIGWTLSRANYITLTKIAIPLTFLMFLNYYALFFTFETALRQIGILTTTFLSGIALYFSAERPQPLRLTTIDLIFISYYLQSGIVIVTSAIASQLGEKSFYLAMDILKFEAPLGLIALIVFIFYRIKAVRLRPNIS